jgi:tight adherence protein C
MFELAEAISIAMAFVIVFFGYLVFQEWFSNERLIDRVEEVMAARKGIILNKNRDKKRDDQSIKGIAKRIGTWFASTGMFNAKNLESLQSSLRAAGIRDNTAYTVLIGAKIIAGIGLPILTTLLALGMHIKGIEVLAFSFGGMVVGLMAPEWSLRAFKTKYQKAIQEGIPDALDLMIICVDSGLGLETALKRVAHDMAADYPILSTELQITSQDIQINPDVNAALKALANRTQIESVGRLVSTLLQSINRGTPLIQALRSLSDEMRRAALVEFEEKAAKLPTKMTVPMITFILPALMTVIVGPAVGGIFKALAHSHAFGK